MTAKNFYIFRIYIIVNKSINVKINYEQEGRAFEKSSFIIWVPVDEKPWTKPFINDPPNYLTLKQSLKGNVSVTIEIFHSKRKMIYFLELQLSYFSQRQEPKLEPKIHEKFGCSKRVLLQSLRRFVGKQKTYKLTPFYWES